jgi:hypothetical protein
MNKRERSGVMELRVARDAFQLLSAHVTLAPLMAQVTSLSEGSLS